MTLNEFNQQIYSSISKEQWKEIFESLKRKIDLRIKQMSADAEDVDFYKPLILPGFFPYSEYKKLQEDAEIILDVQFKILKTLMSELDELELLRTFDVSPSIKDLIDWNKMRSIKPEIGRFDIVFSNDGKIYFCELNLDPSLGGGEGFFYMETFKSMYPDLLPFELHYDSFYRSLATFIVDKARSHDKEEVALFNWSTWAHTAIFNHRYMMGHFDKLGFPISIKTEKDLLTPNFPGEKYFYYRAFLSEDIGNELENIKPFWAAAKPFLFTSFESEIYSAKIWFGLFHQERFQKLLSKEEKDAVLRRIPHTTIVSSENITDLLNRKDELIFKPNIGYGGAGIMVGHSSSTAMIQNTLEKDPSKKWIAQPLLSDSTIDFPHDSSMEFNPYQSVIGLYKTGKVYSGLNLRAKRTDQNDQIVNLSRGGAVVGWMLPVDIDWE